MRLLVGIAGLLACARHASASAPAREPPSPAVIATEAASTSAPPRARKLLLTEVHLGGGAVWLPDDRVGAFSRLGGGILRTRGPQPVATTLGFATALESWFHSDGGGTALALLGSAGLRALPLFVSFEAGANLFAIDNLDDESGLGLLSPRAGAHLGIELGVFRLAGHAAAQWRWRFGAPSLPLLQVGGTLGFVFDD